MDNNCFDHEIGCKKCSTKFFIPNYFDKKDCEELLGKPMKDKEFEAFILHYQHIEAEKLSNRVYKLLHEYYYG